MQRGASPASSLVTTGAIAGGISACVLTAFLFATSSLATVIRFDKVDAPPATITPSGTLLIWSFAVGLAWGIGYAFVAARTPQVVARPLVSGIVYGLFVMLITWIIEVGGAMWNVPTTLNLVRQLIGYAVFYGLPLAYLTARRIKPA